MNGEQDLVSQSRLEWTLNTRQRVTGQDGGSERAQQAERVLLVPPKDCNHASLALNDESESHKAAAGKSGCVNWQRL